MMNTYFERAAKRNAAGFTLIELMICVAVVAILAMVAYPSYQSSLRKARRTDAKNALLDFAAREERYYSVNNQYSNSPANLGYSGAAFPINIVSVSDAYYTLNVPAPGAGTATTSPTFTASAVPIGVQAVDTCGTFVINNLGQQTNTGNTTATASCW